MSCKPAFEGPWRWFLWICSLLVGVAWAVFALVVVLLVLSAIGVEPNLWTYYFPWLLLAASLLKLSRIFRTRVARQYLESNSLKNARLRLDVNGATFENGRSKAFTDWRDISDLVSDKKMLVLVKAANGLVLPNQLCEEMGLDSTEVRRQVQIWFEASREKT